jgi:hypothetical protein
MVMGFARNLVLRQLTFDQIKWPLELLTSSVTGRLLLPYIVPLFTLGSSDRPRRTCSDPPICTDLRIDWAILPSKAVLDLLARRPATLN